MFELILCEKTSLMCMGGIMTIKECYIKLGGDYDDVYARLQSESLIERFMKKFLEDKSMDSLKQAVMNEQIEDAFKAAHTLKGVSGNLSYTQLQKAVSDLTEQLRPCDVLADKGLYNEVERQYDLVTSTIRDYFEQK